MFKMKKTWNTTYEEWGREMIFKTAPQMKSAEVNVWGKILVIF